MKTTFLNATRYMAYTFLMFLLPVATALANDSDSFEDDTQDVAQAPINDYVLVALFVAIILAFFIYAKQNKQQTI